MIYEKIHAQDNLEQAWKRVKANRAGAGVDKVTLETFEKHLAFNLDRIARQLKEGTYKPLPVVVFKDHKGKKKERTLGIPTVRDRVVQQAVLRVISPYFENRFLPCSFAYRSKKSALSAVNKADGLIKSGLLWVLQMDVKHFFDTMDHQILLDLIRKVIDEKPLSKLISGLLKARIFREMGLFDSVQGAVQGSGLSPLLSNIYLHPLDFVLWSKFKDHYLRYSDDIIFFARGKDTLETAQTLIEKGLQELKLEIHPGKTKVSHIAEGIVYLGYHLDSQGKGPAKKAVNQLQSRLADFDKIRKTDNVQEKLQEVTAIIRGWFSYFQTLTPIQPQNVLALLALIRLAREKDQLQMARTWLKQSDQFKYAHPDVAMMLGDHFAGFGQEKQAIREYAKALELDATLETAKEKIRNLQESGQDIHQAIERIQLVLHHNPHYQQGYEQLARYYADLGLFGFAEKAHQKALEIDDPSEIGTPAPEIPSYPETDFNHKEVDLNQFLSLFRGRTGIHAKQWIDERGKWGFLQVDRSLKTKDIYKHLVGEMTLAVYPVTARDMVHFIVFDVDTAKKRILQAEQEDFTRFIFQAHQDILRIKTVCDHLGLAIYIEDSGYKGRHGWLFFADAFPAARAIHLGREIMKKAGGPSEGMVWELFPMGKTERHKSVIKLPLGINQKNKRRCYFLQDDNHPVNDQALLLKTIQKNSFDQVIQVLNIEEEKLCDPDKPSDNDENDFTGLSAGLSTMISQCKLINHLVNKARETNYLNHYERICLLYTLTFAGDEGGRLLHKIISYCINYSYSVTQREIDKRKDSPISCARIGEYFPELAETLPCDCSFDLPARSYPSPALYLLQAELEAGDVKDTFFRRNEPSKSESLDEKGEKETMDEEEEAVLDFDKIFASEAEFAEETAPGILNEEQESESIDDDGSDFFSDKIVSDFSENVHAVESFIEKEAEVQTIANMEETRDQMSAWELALHFFELKHDMKKISKDFHDTEKQLKTLLSNCENNLLQTETGNIQAVFKKDGHIDLMIETRTS